MKAKSRGACRSVYLGTALTGLAILAGWPAVAGAEPSAEDLARYKARYQAALANLWGGNPSAAIDPLYRLYQEEGCVHHKCEMRLAQAYRALGDLGEAHTWSVAAVERAARKGLSGAEEYNELGVCLFEMAGVDRVYLEESVAALRQAVARHTLEGDTYLYNLSQVLLAAGHTEEAGEILRDFQDAKSLRPIIEKGEAVLGEYQRLQVVDRKYAKYTLEAKRQGTEGQILIRAVIDAEGKVADTEVLYGLPHGLNEEALKALRRSEFRPATLNGEPVAALYHQSVDMKLTAAVVSQRQIGGEPN